MTIIMNVAKNAAHLPAEAPACRKRRPGGTPLMQHPPDAACSRCCDIRSARPLCVHVGPDANAMWTGEAIGMKRNLLTVAEVLSPVVSIMCMLRPGDLGRKPETVQPQHDSRACGRKAKDACG